MRVFAVRLLYHKMGHMSTSQWLQLFMVPLITCWKMAMVSPSPCLAMLRMCRSHHQGPASGSSSNAHVVSITNVLQNFQKWEPKTKDNLETGKQANHDKKKKDWPDVEENALLIKYSCKLTHVHILYPPAITHRFLNSLVISQFLNYYTAWKGEMWCYLWLKTRI